MLVLDDLYADPHKALAEISILGSRLESADQLAKTYGGYQKLFDVGTFDQVGAPLRLFRPLNYTDTPRFSSPRVFYPFSPYDYHCNHPT